LHREYCRNYLKSKRCFWRHRRDDIPAIISLHLPVITKSTGEVLAAALSDFGSAGQIEGRPLRDEASPPRLRR
jgi:hypothetical protein